MNWINLRTELLRTPEFLGAKDGAIETWLRVLAYCCEQENGGVMEGSENWSEKVWTCAAGVSKQQVIDAEPLIQVKDGNHVVLGYPKEKQAEIEAKREAGKKGGSRSASSTASGSVNESDRGNRKEKGKGNGKEKENHLAGFEAFWDLYPLKQKRSKAEESWVKHGCFRIHETILEALQRAKKSHDWMKDGGQYVPHPTTYLNQHRWEDEIRPAPVVQANGKITPLRQMTPEEKEFVQSNLEYLDRTNGTH